MIISVDAGKFPKIRHPSMIKLQNMDIEGTYLNMTKTTYDKPTANLILSGAKLKAYPLRSGTRQEGPLLPLLFNLVLGVLWKVAVNVSLPLKFQWESEETFPSLFKV